jgi:IgGFc binding protein
MKHLRISLGMVLVAAVAGVAVLSVPACGSSNSTGSPDSGSGTTLDGSVDTGAGSDAGTGGDSSSCIVCGGGDGGTGPGMQSPIPTTCADSIARNSYIGCDYWPTVTLNPVWPQFDFAVAVSNPQSTPVMVSVSGGALTHLLTVSVPAGQVQAITLPWVPELKGPTFDQNTVVGDPGPSRIVTTGAYHLFTTAPVSVYQFSALEYEIDAGTLGPDGGTCPGEGDGGAGAHCFSYSNDASLLLPTNVAGTDYGILAWPSFAATPGFMAVVATHANTHVTVFASNRVQGVPGTGPDFLLRGDSYTYTLPNEGDVLEMFSDTGDLYDPVYGQDISGTIVEADNPIVAYGGHGCTYIPQNKKACDHLESSMFPIQALGEQYIVTMPHTPHGEGEWIRIMAFYPNTKIAFDHPIDGTSGVILGAGEVLDLPNVNAAFAVAANGRIAISHYELGEFDTVADDAGVPSPDLGDPSQCPVIPIAQYRSTYSFLAPLSYSQNWIDIVAPMSQALEIKLDGIGIPLGDFHQVGNQPYWIAHEQLLNGKEGHSLTGNTTFGLYVYGYGSRTSYMYPGGLDLRVQVIPPPPSQ